MFDRHSRPCGRFFLCLLISAGLTWAQSPQLTTISDTVFRADGTPAGGTLLISWPAFTTANGQAVAAGNTSVTLGAGGSLSVSLVPNANATPPNTVYQVIYQLNDGSVKTEFWIVPTTSPADLAQVRTTLGAPSSASQMATQQFVNAAVAPKANDVAVVHLAGQETITGVKQFTVSPSFPTPVQPSDAVNKSYVDNAVQNVGGGSYVSTSGGTMTGPLTLSGDPSSNLQAATKHYVDINTAVKANLIAGLVPPAELGTGTPASTTCLLGNQTWGPCGAGGGSSSYINGTLVANPNFNSATPSPQSNFLNCSFQNSASSVSLQCPYGNTSSSFALGNQAVLNNQANTFGAGVQDFSTAGLKLPNGPGYTPTSSGLIGFDTTANMPVININGITQQLALTTSNISGQANTALALGATPAQCNGTFATGIQANGNANCGTADVLQLAETSQPSGIPNYGLFWFDSATHTPRVIDNNGQVVQLGSMNLFNSDANTLEEYNGTNPQTLNVYGTRTDANDYERLRLGYDTTDSYFFLGADAAGTGTQRGLGFWMQGSLRWVIDSAFDLKPWSDNLKDIGSSTLRVHDLYLGTGLVFNSGTLSGVHGTTGIAAEAGTLGTTVGAGLCNDGNGNVTDQGCTAGAVGSVFGRTGVVVAQTGDYSVNQITGAAPLASPALTGTPTAPTPPSSDSSTKIATTAWVNAQGYGNSSGNVSGPSSSVSGDVASFNGVNGKVIQDSGVAVSSLAPLSSPALTGTPTAPTPSVTDNSQNIATTAYVQNQAYAPLNSPALAGAPTAPTPSTSDNSTKIATTAWVKNQGYGTGGGGLPNNMTPGGAVLAATASTIVTTSARLDASQFSGSDAFAQVAACIAALPATGGKCDASNLPASNTVSSVLTLSNLKNVSVEWGAQVFTAASGSTAKIVVTGSPAVTFKCVYGGANGNLGGTFFDFSAVAGGSVAGVSAGNDIAVTNSTDFKMEGCAVRGDRILAGDVQNGRSNITVTNSPGTVLRDNTFVEAGYYGVNMSNTDNYTLEGNYEAHASYAGFNQNVTSATGHAQHGLKQVIGNQWYDNDTAVGACTSNPTWCTAGNGPGGGIIYTGSYQFNPVSSGGWGWTDNFHAVNNVVGNDIVGGDGSGVDDACTGWTGGIGTSGSTTATGCLGGIQPLSLTNSEISGNNVFNTQAECIAVSGERLKVHHNTTRQCRAGSNGVPVDDGSGGISVFLSNVATNSPTTQNDIEVDDNTTECAGYGVQVILGAGVAANGLTWNHVNIHDNSGIPGTWVSGCTLNDGIKIDNSSGTNCSGGNCSWQLTNSAFSNNFYDTATNPWKTYGTQPTGSWTVDGFPGTLGTSVTAPSPLQSIGGFVSGTGTSPNLVLNTTTVNGHALSANVTVSASDLTTGTLPHAQLPALVSGDIPNNAANTTGTAANLSGTPTLPNGTTATTPPAGDNSTKIATTAYVQAQTTSLPWFTQPFSNGNGITLSSSTNKAYLYGVVLSYPIATTQVTYYVVTSDNSANTYDIGIYQGTSGVTDTLLAHLGSTAGTTFAPSTGWKTLGWTSPVTLQPGRYYLAITSSCTSSCAQIGSGSTSTGFTFDYNNALGVATGGTLPASITGPTDTYTVASIPVWAVH